MLSYGLPLCICLQKSDINLKEAVELAQCNISTLENVRKNIDKEFKLMFKEAKVNIIYLIKFKLNIINFNI